MTTSAAYLLDNSLRSSHEPRVLFAAAAERVGLIGSGETLDERLVEYALEIVRLSARIADGYPNPSCTEDTVGDAIRAHLYEV